MWAKNKQVIDMKIPVATYLSIFNRTGTVQFISPLSPFGFAVLAFVAIDEQNIVWVMELIIEHIIDITTYLHQTPIQYCKDLEGFSEWIEATSVAPLIQMGQRNRPFKTLSVTV